MASTGLYNLKELNGVSGLSTILGLGLKASDLRSGIYVMGAGFHCRVLGLELALGF